MARLAADSCASVSAHNPHPSKIEVMTHLGALGGRQLRQQRRAPLRLQAVHLPLQRGACLLALRQLASGDVKWRRLSFVLALVLQLSITARAGKKGEGGGSSHTPHSVFASSQVPPPKHPHTPTWRADVDSCSAMPCACCLSDCASLRSASSWPLCWNKTAGVLDQGVGCGGLLSFCARALGARARESTRRGPGGGRLQTWTHLRCVRRAPSFCASPSACPHSPSSARSAACASCSACCSRCSSDVTSCVWCWQWLLVWEGAGGHWA